jgi:5-formyltetrahydrofolate cyclo-ligase
MTFAPCSDAAPLCAGRFGIPEPAPGAPQGDCPAPDLIILPGLAFDRTGTRLGAGGGYYDRLLARPSYADIPRLGLAYAFQLVETLPREAWDLPVHAVCSEQGILWIP